MMDRVKRVSEMVMDGLRLRLGLRLSPEEIRLAAQLRGNEPLYKALTELIRSRIQGRDNLPVPSDPQDCKSILERQSELRWLLGRIEVLYRSPANTGVEEQGEQPAA